MQPEQLISGTRCVGSYESEAAYKQLVDPANFLPGSWAWVAGVKTIINPAVAVNTRSVIKYASVVEFGYGNLVVDTGTYNGRPAVFVAAAKEPGVVGESSARERNPTDALEKGEMVLTFNTAEQATRVANALVGL